jgi:hypothetical protein
MSPFSQTTVYQQLPPHRTLLLIVVTIILHLPSTVHVRRLLETPTSNYITQSHPPAQRLAPSAASPLRLLFPQCCPSPTHVPALRSPAYGHRRHPRLAPTPAPGPRRVPLCRHHATSEPPLLHALGSSTIMADLVLPHRRASYQGACADTILPTIATKVA